jgi:hypothetical protein
LKIHAAAPRATARSRRKNIAAMQHPGAEFIA